MRSRLAERIRPLELIEARAAAEAKPLPTPPAPKPLGWGRDMLAFLRSQDAADLAPAAVLEPVPLTDWFARLADDWEHVENNLNNHGAAIVREANRNAACDQYGTHVATAPLLSELTELTAVQLVNWRQALRVHAEDELALYDAELAVAL